MPRNPYLGGNPTPFTRGAYPYPTFAPQPMKSPDQYKAELLQQLQPNLDAYNQQYAEYQKQQTNMANSGRYIKVASYDEVKNIQATSDGKPIIIIDEANGMLYSKKFEDGTEFIKGFKLVPNEAEEETPVKVEEETKDDPLSQILEKLNSFDDRLSKLEGLIMRKVVMTLAYTGYQIQLIMLSLKLRPMKANLKKRKKKNLKRLNNKKQSTRKGAFLIVNFVQFFCTVSKNKNFTVFFFFLF